MRGLLSNRSVFNTFRFALTKYLKNKFNYEFERYIPKNNQYIVLANHTTNYDPLMVGLSFPGLLYYVASEHIFRWGFISNIIRFLVAPIPRVKATTEVHTVMKIFKRIKEGLNVCIFAEGNSSFTGETGQIHNTTGKLIKKSGVALITYRLSGGYFSSPRWARTLRRGHVQGRVVREYSPDQLKKMTVNEISEAIKRDLYVNAYEDQHLKPVEYKGKKLAENLETALYICPKCERIATLKSENDKLYCSCGLDLRYTTYGYLESRNDGNLPFKTIVDWSKWQNKKISELAEQYKDYPLDRPIISDDEQSLYLIDNNKSNLLCRGKLSLYIDRLVLTDGNGIDHTFPFAQIFEMNIHSQMVLIFSTLDHKTYEIDSAYPRSAIKYLNLYELLKNK